MRDVGIEEVFIVCGHLREQFQERFRDGRDLGLRIQYVHQDNPLGIAHALSRTEPYVKAPFLLFLGDIFFVAANLRKMLDMYERKEACGILAVKREANPDMIKRNFAVLLHESGNVKRVIEKPRYITNNLKGCGIYLFGLPMFDAVRRTPRTAMRDEYEITSSIQILIDDGYPVYPAEVIDWDMNITIVDDLIVTNLGVLDSLNKDSEIGRNVRFPQGTRVVRSVIGDDVCVEHPITIRNSVIMAGSRVTHTGDLNDSFVMGDFCHSRNSGTRQE